LSATGSDNTPLHNLQHNSNSNHLTSEDRIALLEKEAAHWRAQFEVAKLHQAFVSNPSKDLSTCSCSTAAAGVTVRPAEPETKGSQTLLLLVKSIIQSHSALKIMLWNVKCWGYF